MSRQLKRRKQSTVEKAEESPPRLQVVMREGESEAEALTRTATGPILSAAYTICRIFKYQTQDPEFVYLARELERRQNDAKEGSTALADSILPAQISTLDVLFNSLTRLAYENFKDLDVFERLMRLAMKAQSQSRASLEALFAIKNPPVVYARQANIAHGHQQVNNEACTHAERKSEPNELLEANNCKRLDPGTAFEAVSGNSQLEALDAVDRPKNRRGQG